MVPRDFYTFPKAKIARKATRFKLVEEVKTKNGRVVDRGDK